MTAIFASAHCANPNNIVILSEAKDLSSVVNHRRVTVSPVAKPHH